MKKILFIVTALVFALSSYTGVEAGACEPTINTATNGGWGWNGESGCQVSSEDSSVVADLTITATEQPANSLAPARAERIPFTKFTLTAGDEDVMVTGIRAKLNHLTNKNAFDTVYIIGENNYRAGSINIDDDNEILIDGISIVIEQGESKTFTIAADMADDTSDYAGEVAAFSVDSITTEDASVEIKGSLPITGAQHTINSTLQIGEISFTNLISSNRPLVGQKDVEIMSINLHAENEDIDIDAPYVDVYGDNDDESNAVMDLRDIFKNIRVLYKGNNMAFDVHSGYIHINNEDLLIEEGEENNFKVIADIADNVPEDYGRILLDFTSREAIGNAYDYRIEYYAHPSFESLVEVQQHSDQEANITITAPVAGDEWKMGQLNTITWAPYEYGDNPKNPSWEVSAYLDKFVDGEFIEAGEIQHTSKKGSGGTVYYSYLLEPQNGDQYYTQSEPGEYYVRIVNNVTGATDRSGMFTLLPADPELSLYYISGTIGIDDESYDILIKQYKIRNISTSLYKDGVFYKYIKQDMPVENGENTRSSSVTVHWDPVELLVNEIANGEVLSSDVYQIYVSGETLDGNEIHSISNEFSLVLDKNGLEARLHGLNAVINTITSSIVSLEQQQQDIIDGNNSDNSNIDDINAQITSLRAMEQNILNQIAKIEEILQSIAQDDTATTTDDGTPTCTPTSASNTNGGWGWDGTKSCRIEGDIVAGACIDSDGDGWGWDGVNSCRMENVQPTECIDTDGDGWGWDGVQSCRMGGDDNTDTSDDISTDDTTTDDTATSTDDTTEDDTTEDDENQQGSCEATIDSATNGGWGWDGVAGSGCKL